MKKLFSLLLFAAGVIIGVQLGDWLLSIQVIANRLPFVMVRTRNIIIFKCLLGAFIGFILALFIPGISRTQGRNMQSAFSGIKKLSVLQIAEIAAGIIFGLILAALVMIPFNSMGLPAWLHTIITIAIYIMSLYICTTIVSLKAPDVMSLFKGITVKDESKKKSKKILPGGKILDTSVIIDGRIYDILKTGFIDGPIIIPQFVLFELQTIADSSDNIKRNRGKRGLDILNRIQNELPVEVIITDKDYPNITEVDTKLLKLAGDISGKVVTNDYNLNKIAELQGVTVLNTNELSNAIKTIVLPGEMLYIKVLKEGKEHSQGIAYLEDGTMIVVEEGKSYIGKEIEAIVTSVLQTAAGRMIFVRPKNQVSEI